MEVQFSTKKKKSTLLFVYYSYLTDNSNCYCFTGEPNWPKFVLANIEIRQDKAYNDGKEANNNYLSRDKSLNTCMYTLLQEQIERIGNYFQLKQLQFFAASGLIRIELSLLLSVSAFQFSHQSFGGFSTIKILTLNICSADRRGNSDIPRHSHKSRLIITFFSSYFCLYN